MTGSFAEKIHALIVHHGWTQQQAADAFGVSQPTIFRWLRGTSPEGHHRDLVNEAFEKLPGRQVQTQTQIVHAPETSGIEVAGIIQAGNWLDTSLIDDAADERDFIPVARDHRFPHARQYALEVRGDSMDREYPEGSYVICVDFSESGLKMRDGMIVHIERWRHDLREITLKVLRREGDGWCLEPRSHNPIHKPIFMDGYVEEGTEVRIRGVVIGDYRRRVV